MFVFFLNQLLKDFTSDDARRFLLSIEAFAVLFLISCHVALFSPMSRQSGAQARVLLMPAVEKSIQEAIAVDVRSLTDFLFLQLSNFQQQQSSRKLSQH